MHANEFLERWARIAGSKTLRVLCSYEAFHLITMGVSHARIKENRGESPAVVAYVVREVNVSYFEKAWL